MTQKKVAEVLLKYSVDDASLQKAVQSNKSVALSFNSMAEAAKSLGITEAELRRMTGETDAAAQKSALLARVWDDNTRAANGFVTELEAIQRAEAGVARQADSSARSVGALASRLEQAAKVRASAGDATGGLRDAAFGAPAGGNAALVGSLRSAQAAAIALPGVGYQSPLVIGIRGLAIAADKTGASVGQLATGVGIAGVAVIALAVAFARFNEQLENSKKALSAALSANQQYYDALASSTTEQVDAQIKQLQQARPALEENVQLLQEKLESAFKQASQTPLGDPGARILFNQLPTGDLKSAFDEADKALQENINLETRLTQGRQAGAFAANDMREREQQLADIRRKNSEQVVNKVGQDLLNQAQIEVRAQQMTREEREKQLADLSQQIVSNREYRQSLIDIQKTLDPTTEAYRGYQQAIDGLEESNGKLEIEYNIISRVGKSAADGVAEFNTRIAESLSIIQSGIAAYQQLSEQIRTSTVDQVTDRLYALQEEAAALREFIPELEKLAPTSKDAADQLASARERLKEIGIEVGQQLADVLPAAFMRAQLALQAEIDEILKQSGDRIAQIRTDEADKEASAFDDRTKAYLNAQEKRDEALQDLAEQQAQKRAEIERKANATITNAIFARNALAAYLAEQQKKQDLIDLDEQGKARQKEIDKQYDKEKRIADERYAEQIRQAQDAARKAIAVEQQKAQQEINAKVAAYNAQIQALSVFTNQGTQFVYDFVNNSLQALNQLATASSQIAPGIIETPGAWSPLPPPSGYQPAQPVVPSPGGGRGYFPVPYALGGLAQPDIIQVNETGIESAYNSRTKRLMLLSEPMRIFSPTMTSRMLNSTGGGLTINVPIQGSQMLKRDIVRAVDETLETRLTLAGFE